MDQCPFCNYINTTTSTSSDWYCNCLKHIIKNRAKFVSTDFHGKRFTSTYYFDLDKIKISYTKDDSIFDDIKFYLFGICINIRGNIKQLPPDKLHQILIQIPNNIKDSHSKMENYIDRILKLYSFT